jgi:hypothetical protein
MHFLKSLVPQFIKNLYHLAQAFAANAWYGFPGKKLKVIGVTGIVMVSLGVERLG